MNDFKSPNMNKILETGLFNLATHLFISVFQKFHYYNIIMSLLLSYQNFE